MVRAGFLLLRYEDLKTNPTQELAKAAEFLGIWDNSESLTRVKLSSAERMRELEARDENQWIEKLVPRAKIFDSLAGHRLVAAGLYLEAMHEQ